MNLARLRWRLAAPGRAFIAWQADIPDEGRVTVVGLLLGSVGLLFVWPPLAAVVPGIALAAVGLGFNMRDRVVATATVIAAASVTAVALVVR